MLEDAVLARTSAEAHAGRRDGARSGVRIREVSLFPVTTPRVSGEPSQHVLLRLVADDGTQGWGEMSDLSHMPALMPDVGDLELCLRAILMGRDVFSIGQIEELMLANFPGTRFYGKASLVRAGVSIAVHDLKARLLGVPLYDLLGGKRRDRIPVCFPIFRMRSREDVSDRVELVRMKRDEGFRAFRFYFGHRTDADEALLDEVCGRFDDIVLTSMDGSGLFTVPQFMRAYQRLRRFPFESVESPVERDDVEAMAEVRGRIDHPVSEHVRSPEYALRLIKARAVDIFNISITVAGGIQGMQNLFALATAANLECLIGTTQEMSVATAAQAHVGAAAPRLDYASDPVGPYLYDADVTRERTRFENGDLLVPEGVGLGVEVDMEAVRAISEPLSALSGVETQFTRG